MSLVLEKEHYVGFYKMVMPIILSVFSIYLSIGIVLGVLPSFVQENLHYNSIMVGIVIGFQFFATLLTRAYSGKMTDTKGAKKSKTTGIFFALIAGIAYILAAFLQEQPALALVILIVARIIHGIAESLLVTGALTWGIGLVGPSRSGKVMTWNGIAMYAGIAIGAPLSITMVTHFGSLFAFFPLIVLPLISWMSTVRLPELPLLKNQIRTPFYKVIGAVSKEGLGLAFSSIAFGCLASFIALFFNEKNWGSASLAFIVFGTCYVLTRIFFASFPDKYGGYKIALISLTIEIVGQLFIWLSVSKTMAIIGAGLTGIGFSLVFPALGVLAIQRVKPQMRGTALGAYVAFVDLSLGITGPLAGLVASWFSYQSVYLFGAISCIISFTLLLFNRKK